MKSFGFEEAAPVLSWLQKNTPLVNCLTNNVSKNFVANALLAVGASPSMVEASAEISAFTLVADATVVNVGSLVDYRLRGISMAVQTAHENGKPWILDPAAVSESLFYRSSFARELLRYYPAIIRGNAAEIMFLAGEKSSSRGADSLSSSDEALRAAKLLAGDQNCVVVVSGKKDYVTNGKETFCIMGGDPKMARVTGTGCALSAIMGATACAQYDFLRAAAAACVVMKHAGEYAALNSRGLGSFASALLDGLTIDKLS